MDRNALMLLVIVAATLTTCTGQLGGMGGMMEGMAGMGGMGGMGGLAAMMGGEGGMAGMMGGMGGGMGGMGGIGGMISSMIAPMIANSIATTKMNELVKMAVGYHALPSRRMIEYAKTQRRIPANVDEMVPYIEMMIELTKTSGILMPDGTIKKPVLPVTLGAVPATVPATAPATAPATGRPTMDKVKELIVERGLKWYNEQQPQTFGPQSGAGGLGGGFVF